MDKDLLERAEQLERVQAQRESGAFDPTDPDIIARANELETLSTGKTITDAAIEKMNVAPATAETDPSQKPIDDWARSLLSPQPIAESQQTITAPSAPWISPEAFESSAFNKFATPLTSGERPDRIGMTDRDPFSIFTTTRSKSPTVYTRNLPDFIQPEGLKEIGSSVEPSTLEKIGGVMARGPMKTLVEKLYVTPEELVPLESQTQATTLQTINWMLNKTPLVGLINKFIPQRLKKDVVDGIAMAMDLLPQGLAGGAQAINESRQLARKNYDKGGWNVATGVVYDVGGLVHGTFAGLMNTTGGGVLFQAGQKVIEAAVPESKSLFEKGFAPVSSTIRDLEENNGVEVPEFVKATASLLDAAFGIVIFKKAHEFARSNYESFRVYHGGSAVDPMAKYSSLDLAIPTIELQARKVLDEAQAKRAEAAELVKTLQDEATGKPHTDQTDMQTGTASPTRDPNAAMTQKEKSDLIADEIAELEKMRAAIGTNQELAQNAVAINKTIEILQTNPTAYVEESIKLTERAIASKGQSPENIAILQEKLARLKRFKNESPSQKSEETVAAEAQTQPVAPTSRIVSTPTARPMPPSSVPLASSVADAAKLKTNLRDVIDGVVQESSDAMASVDVPLSDKASSYHESRIQRANELAKKLDDPNLTAEELGVIQSQVEKLSPQQSGRAEGTISRSELDAMMKDVVGQPVEMTATVTMPTAPTVPPASTPQRVTRTGRIKKGAVKVAPTPTTPEPAVPSTAEPVKGGAPQQTLQGSIPTTVNLVDTPKSRRHLMFAGDKEYFVTDKGEIWEADASKPVGASGVRKGKWAAHNTPEGREALMKKVLAERKPPAEPVKEQQVPPPAAPTASKADIEARMMSNYERTKAPLNRAVRYVKEWLGIDASTDPSTWEALSQKAWAIGEKMTASDVAKVLQEESLIDTRSENQMENQFLKEIADGFVKTPKVQEILKNAGRDDLLVQEFTNLTRPQIQEVLLIIKKSESYDEGGGKPSRPLGRSGRILKKEERLGLATTSRVAEESGLPWTDYARKGETAPSTYANESLAKRAANVLTRNNPNREARPVQRGDKWGIEVRDRVQTTASTVEPPPVLKVEDVVAGDKTASDALSGLDDLFEEGGSLPIDPKSRAYSPQASGTYDPSKLPNMTEKFKAVLAKFEAEGKTFEDFVDAMIQRFDGRGHDTMRYLREIFPDKMMPEITADMKKIMAQRIEAAKKGMKDAGVDDATADRVEAGVNKDGSPITARDIVTTGQGTAKQQSAANDVPKRNDLIRQAKSSPERARLRDQLLSTDWGAGKETVIDAGLEFWDQHAARWAEITGESPEAWYRTRGVEVRGTGQEKIGQGAVAFSGETAIEFRKTGEIVLNAIKAPNAQSFMGNSFQLFFADMSMTLRELNRKISSMDPSSEATSDLGRARDLLIADINQFEKAVGLRTGEFSDLFTMVQRGVSSPQMELRLRNAMDQVSDIADQFFAGQSSNRFISKDLVGAVSRFQAWATQFWQTALRKFKGHELSDSTREAIHRWFNYRDPVHVKPHLGQRATIRDYSGIGSHLARWMNVEVAPIVNRRMGTLGARPLSDPHMIMEALSQIFKSYTNDMVRFTTLREAREFVHDMDQRHRIATHLTDVMKINIDDPYKDLSPAERAKAKETDDLAVRYLSAVRNERYGIDRINSVPLRIKVELHLAEVMRTSPSKLLMDHVNQISKELQATYDDLAKAESNLKSAKAEVDKEIAKAKKLAAETGVERVESESLKMAVLKREGYSTLLHNLKMEATDLDRLFTYLAGSVESKRVRRVVDVEAEPVDAEIVAEMYKSPRSEGFIAFVGDKEFFVEGNQIMKADITPEMPTGELRRKGVVHDRLTKENVAGVKWMAEQSPKTLRETETIKEEVTTIEDPANAESFKDFVVDEIKQDLAALDIFGNKAEEMGWRETRLIVETVRYGNAKPFTPYETESGAKVTLPVLKQAIQLVQHMTRSDDLYHRALIRDFFEELTYRGKTDPILHTVPTVSEIRGTEGHYPRYKVDEIEVATGDADFVGAQKYRDSLVKGGLVNFIDPASGDFVEGGQIIDIVKGQSGAKYIDVDAGAVHGRTYRIPMDVVWENAAQHGIKKRRIVRELTQDEELEIEKRTSTPVGVSPTKSPSRRLSYIAAANQAGAISPPTGTKEVSIEHIVNYFQRAFNLPINTKGKLMRFRSIIFGNGRLPEEGIYREATGSIWTRQYGNLDAISHELGHHIWKNYLQTNALLTSRQNAMIRMEMSRLDYMPQRGDLNEGFSEYMRMLLTNRSVQSVAPNLHQWFENTFLPANPTLQEAIKVGRQKVFDYQQMSAITKANSLLDDIGGGKFSDATFKDKAVGTWNWIKRSTPLHWTNAGDPLERWTKDILTRAATPQMMASYSASKDPAQLQLYVNKAAPAKARYWVEKGIRNFRGDLVCESLSSMITQLAQGDPQKLKNGVVYAFALRAEELLGRDPSINVGLSALEIAEIKTQFSDPAYQVFADGLHRWNHHVLQYLIDAGGLSAEEGAIIRDANLMYIPLQIAKEGHWDVSMGKWYKGGSEFKEGLVGSGGRGMVDLGKPYHKITGSKMGKVNPIEAMAYQTERIIALADKARIGRAMVELADMTEGLAPFIEEVFPMKATTVRVEAMASQLRRMGMNLPASSIDKLVTVFSNADEYFGTEDVVSIVHNGKRRWFKIDKALHEGLRSTTYKQYSPVWNLLFAPARFVRVGTTGYNAAFNLLTNPIRDAQTAFLQNDKNEASRNIFKAMAQIWGDMTGSTLRKVGVNIQPNAEVNLARELWEAGGGAMSQPLGQEMFGQSNVQRMVNDAILKGNIKGKAVDIALHPAEAFGKLIDSYKKMISLPESVPREAEFLRVMDRYRSQITQAEASGNVEHANRLREDMMVEAGNAASDITVNFRRAGVYAQFLNQLIPFFNPSIQGTAKAYRMFRYHPEQAVLRSATLSAVSLGLFALNKDEDWYKALPAWERYGFWHFSIGKDVVRLPMPFEYGYFFGGIPQAIANDVYYKSGTEETKTILDQMARNLLPVNVAPVTTDLAYGNLSFPDAIEEQFMEGMLGEVAAIRPLMEAYKNKDFFRNRPLVPKDLEEVQNWLQYTSNTPETIKRIGAMFEGTGLSPIILDHLASGYTGGLAREFLKFPTSAGLIKSSMPMEKSDWMIVGRLFTRSNVLGFGSKDVQTFYNTLDKINEAKKTIDKISPPRGDRPVNEAALQVAISGKHITQKELALYKLYQPFNEARTYLQEQRRVENGLRENSSMPDDLKRAISESIALNVRERVMEANRLAQLIPYLE